MSTTGRYTLILLLTCLLNIVSILLVNVHMSSLHFTTPARYRLSPNIAMTKMGPQESEF